MEILHFFYLSSLLFNWLDRSLFQSRPESLAQIRDLLFDSSGALERNPVLVGPLKRPFAIGFNMLLTLPVAWFLAIAIALGPVEILVKPFCGPGPTLETIQTVAGCSVFLLAWIFGTRWLLKWYWFPALELSRDGVMCLMGKKRLFVPWYLLDCLPAEPFVDKTSEEEMAAIRPPRGLNPQDAMRYFENEQARKPWDQALFPIQVSPTGAILFSNWFAIPHKLLVKMLSALAANQVLSGRGIADELPKSGE